MLTSGELSYPQWMQDLLAFYSPDSTQGDAPHALLDNTETVRLRFARELPFALRPIKLKLTC